VTKGPPSEEGEVEEGEIEEGEVEEGEIQTDNALEDGRDTSSTIKTEHAAPQPPAQVRRH
jgi:hypothetical protein